MQVHAYTITFTCIGKVCTSPGTMSGQFPYQDVTRGSALESQNVTQAE